MFPERIHFIGIGGIGVSAIAKLLMEQGITISGSDQTPSQITQEFENLNVKISYQHTASNITTDQQMVIYSPAIAENNPELLAAQQLNIPTLSYPQALGKFSESYFTIAISGTHGKSTTTAMIALAAIHAGLEPNVIIGTKLRELNNQNYRSGESNLLILEACEYKESFQYLNPDILAITNIEPDHLDYYKNENNYYQAFKKLIVKTAETGKVLVSPNFKIPQQLESISKILKFAESIKLNLSVPGEFNLQNAALANSVLTQISVPKEKSTESLEKFTGTWRRFEYHHQIFPETIMIDDYGHHPNEISVTLKAVREKHPQAKILLVFQPHQYSRTKHFFSQFVEVLASAPVDEIIIPNIYQVRDSQSDIDSVSPEELINAINKQVQNKAKFGDGLENTAQYLKNNHSEYQVIVTMGAGNIENIYKLLS